MFQFNKVVNQPICNDVLCGRGAKINHHEGNIQFRAFVDMRKERYTKAKTKSEKALISREIIDCITSLDPPGRFLNKDKESGAWYVEKKDNALKKTSQALREGGIRKVENRFDQVRTTLSREISSGKGETQPGRDSTASDTMKNHPSEINNSLDIYLGNPPIFVLDHRNTVSDAHNNQLHQKFDYTYNMQIPINEDTNVVSVYGDADDYGKSCHGGYYTMFDQV